MGMLHCDQAVHGLSCRRRGGLQKISGGALEDCCEADSSLIQLVKAGVHKYPTLAA